MMKKDGGNLMKDLSDAGKNQFIRITLKFGNLYVINDMRYQSAVPKIRKEASCLTLRDRQVSVSRSYVLIVIWFIPNLSTYPLGWLMVIDFALFYLYHCCICCCQKC